jgi:hypothetical protein
MYQNDWSYMKNIKKLIALTTVMALCASQAQSQDFGGYQDPGYVTDSPAYDDGFAASTDNRVAWGVAGVVVVGVIIWLATRHHHHHHHSSSRSSSSSSSSSFSHN